MFGDRDGCEWVNVLSVTGLPPVVPDKGLLSGCVYVCCKSAITTSSTSVLTAIFHVNVGYLVTLSLFPHLS